MLKTTHILHSEIELMTLKVHGVTEFTLEINCTEIYCAVDVVFLNGILQAYSNLDRVVRSFNILTTNSRREHVVSWL